MPPGFECPFPVPSQLGRLTHLGGYAGSLFERRFVDVPVEPVSQFDTVFAVRPGAHSDEWIFVCSQERAEVQENKGSVQVCISDNIYTC